MTRRDAIKSSLVASAGLFFAPTIVPAHVLGKNAPSNVINIGQIGYGRIARDHNLPQTIRHNSVRVVAVCDPDARRMEDGRQHILKWYADNRGSDRYVSVRTYQNYRELLAQPDIDAVVISTPDHAHFLPCIEACLAGKDIYMEKPMSLTIEEGRIMSDLLHRQGTVFQLGSQQRSISPWNVFKRGCELVRNGRIGKLHTIEVGLPGDPPGGDPTPASVPPHFDYDLWLAQTPEMPYREDAVHPQQGYGRPGWLRMRQFTAGMITGWGSHHVDTAHWGMGTEHTGPLEISAQATFPDDDPEYDGLWNVHGPFRVEARYAGDMTMIISGEFRNGVRFVGDDGWLFVTRGSAVTDDEPDVGDTSVPLNANDPAILRSEIGPDEIHLYESDEQHANWIRCIRTRQLTVAPAEVAHRSTSACTIAHIAMQLGRTLHWDPVHERFRNDDEANTHLSRSQRYPYMYELIPALQPQK